MIDFILGENKYVKFAVHSRKKEPFTVSSATWELYHYGELEDSGTCEIEKDGDTTILKVQLEPKAHSKRYQLFVTYTIGDEVKKHIEDMEVR